MAIEGLDAGPAIEAAGFVPQVAVAESLEPEAEATLEAALAAAAAPDAGAGSERFRDEVTLDLWVEEGSLAMAPVLHVGGPYDVTGAQLADDDSLILNKLTIEDMDRASGSGRYGDSTEDYVWNEMSTGGWEWAINGVISNAKADITQIVHTSTSLDEARQRVNLYLVERGLASVIQTYNPASYDADGNIVVNGHPPPPAPPTMGNFDPFGGSFGQNDGTTPPDTVPLSNDPIPDNNPDGPDVGIEVTNEANRQHVLDAAEKLKAVIEILDPKFAALSDTQTLMMKDGTVITGAELKVWWQDFAFRVTDREFGLGRGGAVANGVSNMNWVTVNTYMYWDANGLSFITLHEFVHGSPYGERTRDTAFIMHLLFYGVENVYEPNDYWWDVNEEAANWGAREIMEAFGIPTPTHRPTYGYDDSMPASPLTLPPPPPPYLGDDSSGGSGGNVSGE